MTSTSPPWEATLKNSSKWTWSGSPTKSNRKRHQQANKKNNYMEHRYKYFVYQSSYSSGSETKTNRKRHQQANTKNTYMYHHCKSILIVLCLSIQLFHLFWIEISSQRLIPSHFFFSGITLYHRPLLLSTILFLVHISLMVHKSPNPSLYDKCM